ncbi:MAG: major head subunit [Siphoviridae sp. ctpQM7]|nr:MAG: major head subunit [Siphoviridae sp. ctpQM7]
MAVSLAGARSWFNSTVYYLVEELGKIGKDPVFDLFGEMNYDKKTGDTINFTGRAFGGFAEIVAPGGQIPEATPTEGDQLAKTFLSVKRRLVVEWESYIHDKLDLVKDDVESLVYACTATPALVMSSAILTNADATTVTLPGGLTFANTCADGLAVASASHTVPGTGSTTYRNTTSGTDVLGAAGISNAIQIGNQNIVNDDGVVTSWEPDILLVPNVEPMVRKALEDTKSERVTLSANNTVNVYSGGRFKVYVLKYAPRNAAGGYSTTAGQMYRWAIADSRMLKRAAKYVWAARPQDNVVPKFQNRENLDSVVTVAGRWTYGIPRWQGIVYSLASSAPTLG